MFLRYEPNGHHILKNLNFTIKPQEKVSIEIIIDFFGEIVIKTQNFLWCHTFFCND